MMEAKTSWGQRSHLWGKAERVLPGGSDSQLIPKLNEREECFRSGEHGGTQGRHEAGTREPVRNGTGGDVGARPCRVPRAVVRSWDVIPGVPGSLGEC